MPEILLTPQSAILKRVKLKTGKQSRQKIICMRKLLMICVFGIQSILNAQPLPGFDLTANFEKMAASRDLRLLGEWHNEYLDHVFFSLQNRQFCLQQEDFYKRFNEISYGFFYEKGMLLQQGILQDNDLSAYVSSIYSFSMCRTDLGALSVQLLCRLESLLDQYGHQNLSPDELEVKVESMVEEAFKIEMETERIAVQATLVIATHSLRYWEARALKYREALGNLCQFSKTARLAYSGAHLPSVFQLNFTMPILPGNDETEGFYKETNDLFEEIPVNFYDRSGMIVRLVISDAIGGLQGAIFGGLGGPLGAFAGALLGAGSRSVIRGLFYGFTGL
jgi:hypothetical protein